MARIDMLARPERDVSGEELRRITSLIRRREGREPVARIVGRREFWSLPILLNEATLDPRPESETLVEMALGMLGISPHTRAIPDRKESGDSTTPLRILDLGTGSGCLLLALLREIPEACGIGIDIAPRAVEQAQENARSLDLSEHAIFIVADWNRETLPDILGGSPLFDLIVSNPPYVSQTELATLMPEVRDFDPLAALDGGKDGLDHYRRLIPQLPALLAPKGRAVFEVGHQQANAVADMFAAAGLANVSTRHDLAGIERCVGGTA